MNRETYLYLLQKGIEQLPADVRREIMDEFTAHFDEGRNNGISDEQIIEQLGPVEDLIRDIRNTYGDSEYDFTKLKEGFNWIRDSFSNIFTNVMKGLQLTYFDFSSDPLEDCEQLVVSTGETGIDVKLIPGDYLTYAFKGYKRGENAARPQINVSNDGITCDITIFEGHGTMTVTVPEVTRTLNVQLSSGDINVKNLNIDNADFSTLSGDIDLDDVTAYDLNCKCKSGDINIENCSGDEVVLVTASGDIDADRCSGGSVEAASASGDIDLGKIQAERIHAVSTSGDIEANVVDVFEDITIKSTSGDVSLSVENDDFTAELRTMSGDISVDDDFIIYQSSKRTALVNSGDSSIRITCTSGDINLSSW